MHKFCFDGVLEQMSRKALTFQHLLCGAWTDVTSKSAATKPAVPQVPLHYPFTVNAGDGADDKCTKATLAPQSDAWLIAANGHLLELVDAQNRSQQWGKFVSVSHMLLSTQPTPNKPP